MPAAPAPASTCSPRNFDSITQLYPDLANTGIWTNTIGVLDAQGMASASLNLGPNFGAFAGMHADHMFFTLTPSLVFTYTSEPVGLNLF